VDEKKGILIGRFRYSFICQGTSTRRQRRNLSRYLDQETAKWPFRSSSQAATCYYQSTTQR